MKVDKSKWKKVKLGEVATYINGFAFKPSDWKQVGLPIIRIQNLTDRGAIFNYCDRDDIPKKYLIDSGDVLISWSATLGVFVWNNGKALLNQHIFKVVFNKGEINKNFFVFCIKNSIAEMSKHTNGVTMKHIRKGDFDNIQIPLPPLYEQQAIAKELDSIQSMIGKCREQLEDYDRLARSIFHEMFGDPVNNEKGWECHLFGTICNVINGKSQKKVENLNGPYPIYGSGGLMGYASDYICEAGSTIIGRKGTINNPIYVKEKFWNIDTAFGLFPKNTNEMDYLFLYYLCRSIDFNSIKSGAAIPSLTKTDINKLSIPLPPLPLQQQFAVRIEAIEKMKEATKKQLADLQPLFDSRMQYYFS